MCAEHASASLFSTRSPPTAESHFGLFGEGSSVLYIVYGYVECVCVCVCACVSGCISKLDVLMY